VPQPKAYHNTRFLESRDARALRILAEYLEPLSRFQRQRVQDTSVFLGSARLKSRDAALAALSEAEQNGIGLEASRTALELSEYYEAARSLAHRLTEWSKQLGAEDRRFVICTGGGPGIMEAANRGAHDAGARSVGLNITLPHEQYPNPYVTPDLCFRFHYFAIRKLHFLLRARALVAFPGGYGTMDELFEVLTLAQTRKIGPVPVILVGEAYWRRVLDAEFLVAEGTIDPEDRELFWYAETAADVWRDILSWYEMKGEPLLPAGSAAAIGGPAG
jgi:uncharacterized protein (TIGR00730 family)